MGVAVVTRNSFRLCCLCGSVVVPRSLILCCTNVEVPALAGKVDGERGTDAEREAERATEAVGEERGRVTER